MVPARQILSRVLLAGALLGSLSSAVIAAPAKPAPAKKPVPAKAAPPAKTPAQVGTITLTILHTNDMHGHLAPEVDKKMAPAPETVGGAAYLAAVIKAERAKSPKTTLLIDCGDIAQGTPVSNLFRGKPMVEFMNSLGYDAGTIGNHEFDWGPAAFNAMLTGAKRPIVACNLVTSAGKPIPGVKRFIIKEVGGVKVGITGLVPTETTTISFRKNVAPFRFLDEVSSLKKVVPEMRKAGAQVILLVSHLGDKADLELPKAVPGISIIVGGHSHTAIQEPAFVNGTVILQAGKYMRYLGHADVKIDRKTWKVVDYTKKDALIPVIDAKITPDPAVAALVKKYQDKVGPQLEVVVGEVTADLPKTPAKGQADSVLGNVVCDSMRWKVNADVAIYNAGGIRTDINKGPIKMNDVYTLLPFDNYLVTVSMTGDQIQRVLAQGMSSDHGTLQVSGLTFTIGADGKPTDVKVGEKAIEPGRTYKVATVDFLAEGNDGLTVFKEIKDRVYDELARDVFTAYVMKSTPLAAPATGRITRTDGK